MKAIAALIAAAAALILGTIWRGYVLSILWTWFVVTTFGAKPLSIAAAIGVSCIVGFFSLPTRAGKKDERSQADQWAEAFVLIFLAPLLSLGFGVVVKHWL